MSSGAGRPPSQKTHGPVHIDPPPELVNALITCCERFGGTGLKRGEMVVALLHVASVAAYDTQLSPAVFKSWSHRVFETTVAHLRKIGRKPLG